MDPETNRKGILLDIEAVDPPADGTNPLAGVRVEPGYNRGGGSAFELIRARTEVRRWSESAAAEFFFEVDSGTADLAFGITSWRALTDGAVTVEPVPRRPGDAQEGGEAPNE